MFEPENHSMILAMCTSFVIVDAVVIIKIRIALPR